MRWYIKSDAVQYLSGIIICLLIIAGLNQILLEDAKGAEQDAESEHKAENRSGADKNYDRIRVLIKTDGFAHIVHNEVAVQASGGLVIETGESREEYAAGQEVRIAPDDGRFQAGDITISSKTEEDRIEISSLARGYGAPIYRGSLELHTTAEGIVIVNELPLEEYLYAVVPSEMPSSYENEALKVQAVCARSYAHCQIDEMGYPEYNAHVDDSVSFQVYNNCEENDKTVAAVDETRGEKLIYKGAVVKAYYFSTSCGTTASIAAWGTKETKENAYLRSVEVSNKDGSYEEELAWFKWEAVIPEKTLSGLIELNTGEEIGTLENLEVTETGPGDIAQAITITGSKGEIQVETENKIRTALGGSGYQITKNDGSVVESSKLLPSAFFSVAKEGENYIISGGGYGHGIGMSQNGANEMAKEGKNYKDILSLFYNGVEVNSN